MKKTILLALLTLTTLRLEAYVVGPPSEKWGDPVFGTPGGIVTWSIIPGGTAPGGYSYVPLNTFLPPGYEAQLQWAFAQWSAVANIQFVEVPDNGASVATTPDAGVLRIGGYDVAPGAGILAFTSGPIGTAAEAIFAWDSTTLFATASDIPWSFSDNNGYNFDRVALHEIGHLIGLGHEQSVPSIMNAFYSTALPIALQPDDVTGAQFLYGAATTAAVPEPSMFGIFGAALAMGALLKPRRAIR